MPVFPRAALALAAALVVAPAFAGEAPSATTFSSVPQRKAMSAQHWQVIADDLTKSVLADLGQRTHRGVTVQVAPGAPGFARLMATFVADSLYRQGVQVHDTPREGVLVLRLNTVLASHGSKALPEQSLKWTALTAGVMVLREVASATLPGAVLLGALGTDLASAPTKQAPRSELVVSGSVQDAGVFLSRVSSVYYVEGADLGVLGGVRAPSDERMFRIVQE